MPNFLCFLKNNLSFLKPELHTKGETEGERSAISRSYGQSCPRPWAKTHLLFQAIKTNMIRSEAATWSVQDGDSCLDWRHIKTDGEGFTEGEETGTSLGSRCGQAEGKGVAEDLWTQGNSRDNRAVLQWRDNPVVIWAPLAARWRGISSNKYMETKPHAAKGTMDYTRSQRKN